MSTTVIRGGTVVSSTGLEKKDVAVSDGIIVLGARIETLIGGDEVTGVNAEGMLLFPGLIDCHVHFREPGYEHKATMKSEAAAALAGGVTTVCEMPNTNPPTVTVAALADKVRRAAEIDWLDMRFFFGVTQEDHVRTLVDLWTGTSEEMQRLKEWCAGVKVYFDHSTGNQKAEGEILDSVFNACAKHKIPLVAHCEDSEVNAVALAAVRSGDSQGIASHSLSRPPQSEEKSIEHALSLVRAHGTALHVAHLSTAQGIALVRAAKKEGLPVTCEVTPHHLFLSTDDYGALGTFGKMNPPLRTLDHVAALWEGIADGTVDCISTDHAPHTREEKNASDPLGAPSGVPGVETMFPLLLSVALGAPPRPLPAAAKLSLPDIIRLCIDRPSRIFGLQKTGIIEGASTDVVLVDPNVAWTIEGSTLHSSCGWTPFEGWTVRGDVRALFS